MPLTAVSVRLARLEDLSGLAQLFHHYLEFQGLNYNYADSVIFMEKRLTQVDSKIYVAEKKSDKKLLAFAQLRPQTNSLTQKQVWHLCDIWVDEAYRRQGIARQLTKACEEYSSSCGSQGMVLKVGNSNHHALALFESLGWKKEVLTLFRLNHDQNDESDAGLPF